MAKIKRRSSNEAGTRAYNVVCGTRKVMEAYIYPSRFRRHGGRTYSLQLWSKDGVDEVMQDFDSPSEALERLRREASDIHCSMVGKGK